MTIPSEFNELEALIRRASECLNLAEKSFREGRHVEAARFNFVAESIQKQVSERFSLLAQAIRQRRN